MKFLVDEFPRFGYDCPFFSRGYCHDNIPRSDVAKIEKEHEERYRKLLANIEGDLVFSKENDVVWQCENCGHIVVGKKAPKLCPVCEHPQSYFQVRAENY